MRNDLDESVDRLARGKKNADPRGWDYLLGAVVIIAIVASMLRELASC